MHWDFERFVRKLFEIIIRAGEILCLVFIESSIFESETSDKQLYTSDLVQNDNSPCFISS